MLRWQTARSPRWKSNSVSKLATAPSVSALSLSFPVAAEGLCVRSPLNQQEAQPPYGQSLCQNNVK